MIAVIPPTLAGRRIRLFLRLVGNGMAQATTAVGTALLIRFAFDELLRGFHGPSGRAVAWVAFGLVGAAAGSAWLRMQARIHAERLGQDYAHEVRMVLFDRLTTLAPRAIQKRSRGGLMLRFVGDLAALRQWVSQGLARLTVASVTAVLSLAALSQVNLTLAVGVGAVLGSGAAVALTLGRHLREAVRESRRRHAHLAANVSEKVVSMAVVQVFNQSRRERRRVSHQGRRLREAMVVRAGIAGRLVAVAEATGAVAVASALLLGTGEVASGRATPGTIIAAMTIVRFLVPALRDLGRVHRYWHSSRVSLKKIAEFLATPSLVRESPNAPNLPPGPGCLVFREIALRGVFTHLNATAEAGTVVAIVGPNGAGKSTLLSLAVRLIDPDSGAVLLDGKNISEYKVASVRRAIGMVSADLPLLRGTVERNLRYRRSDASEEELRRVLALCGIDEILTTLPDGAKSRLADGGVNLSLGQRQRLALARAILGEPRVLLLDEAEANLDPQGDAVLDRVLRQYRGTVLMVTHRLDRLAKADRIWHLAGGKVVEAGPPGILLNCDGPTSRLFGVGRSKAS